MTRLRAVLARVHRDESGQTMVLIAVVAVISVFLLSSGMEVNRLVMRSLSGQNSADAAARAAATWQARGLNVIGSANVAQALLMLEFVLPFADGQDREALSLAGADLSAVQEGVASLFPRLALVSASAVARRGGLEAIKASDLREIGLDVYANELEQLRSSSELGGTIAGKLHALPVDRHLGSEMLSLGLELADPSELGELAAEVVASGTVAFDSLLAQLASPPSVVPPHPLLFFGYLAGGDYSLVEGPGAEEDVMALAYTSDAGQRLEATVLTWRGIRKLSRYLESPAPREIIGREGYSVVRAHGPMDVEKVAKMLGRTPEELVAAGVKAAIRASQNDPRFRKFGLSLKREEFWNTGGPWVTLIARSSGWRHGSWSRGSGPAHFFSRARARPGPGLEGDVVFPVYERVGLEPVAEMLP